MYKTKVLCLLLVFLLFSPAIWSGQVSPYLDDYLQGLTTSEDVKVLVMFDEQADIQSLNQQLKVERATLAERNRRVIEALQDVASRTQPEMVAYLDNLKAQGLITEYKTLWIANMAIVNSTKSGVYEMATNANIADIYFSYEIEDEKPVEEPSDPPLIASHEIGLDRINAPAAWAAGFTGAGRVVANMDTGVDGTHSALAARFRGDVDQDGDYDESWFDPYTTNWPFPQDSGEHGTHTMGTICGRTESGSDTIGVAIDAQWIAAAPIDRGGGIPRTVADALLSFQWFADPDGDPRTQDNPDAVGNSWGVTTSHGYPPCDETFWDVIDNLEAAGTAVIFSAGNEGSNPNTLRRPADRATTAYNCFSVGSVNGASPSLPISYFSSRGPSYCTPDGSAAFKPEVVAPGENVRSARPGGGYQTMSGTSMASPHITGAIGVIRSANPDLDVDTIKEILLATAHDLGPEGEDNDYGMGVIDLYEACLVAQQGYGFVEGYVYDENEDIIPGALVSVDGSTRLTHTGDDGYYHLGLPADTSYNITASFFGHVSSSAEVTITPDETVNHDFYLDFAASGVVHGYVTDLDENPIANAVIRVLDTPLDPVTTNDDGYYIMDYVPGGATYNIGATAIGYGFSSEEVFVPVDDTVQQDFALQELESFEGSDGGWTGNGVWEWGEPSSGPGAAYDGLNVWGTVLSGQYPNGANDYLYTIEYPLNGSNYTFSYYQWYDFEDNYDGGNIHISTDGGSTWDLITPVDGYPDDAVIGLGNEPGFTSTSSGWEMVTIDLGAYSGQNVMLGFRFGSDGSVQRDGWYIDAVVVQGEEGLFPACETAPGSMSMSLQQNQSETVPFHIANVGQADLQFSAVVITDEVLANGLNNHSNPVRTAEPDVTVSKHDGLAEYNYTGTKTAEIDTPGDGLVTDFGGPDEYGYTWKDSNEPNGPEYNWIDITGMGTPVQGLGDDTNLGPFDIGFDFPFYGNMFNTFNVCSNGWVSFTSTYTTYNNVGLPSGSEPYNLVAPFWDDLNFNSGGELYYYSSNDSLIISYLDVPHFLEGGPYTYQIILEASGDITFQYGDIIDPLNSCTIGIQNENGSIGLQMVNNSDYVYPEMAIKIRHPLFWLTASPLEGVLAPDESMDMDLTFDATDMEIGSYTGQLVLTTNDPEHRTIAVPCTLLVGQVGVDDNPTSLPSVFSLNQNFPNPFNPTTEISFGLPANGQVTLEVFDVMGRKVTTLVNGDMTAGIHKVIWDGNNSSGEKVTSGMYFYKLTQGDSTVTKKMLMLK